MALALRIAVYFATIGLVLSWPFLLLRWFAPGLSALRDEHSLTATLVAAWLCFVVAGWIGIVVGCIYLQGRL